jgi:hypothetical protein
VRLGGFGYGAITLRRAVRPLVRTFRSLGLRPQDALLASYLKSGNTWLRFMLSEIALGRSPEWEEVDRIVPTVGENRHPREILADGGRLFYTHDTASGPCRRIIYLVRDARDVVVSEHRWVRRGGTDRDLDSYVRAFAAGTSHVFGSWGDHVDHWLGSGPARRGDLLLVRFEDLRVQTARELTRIAEFLDLDGADDDHIRRAVDNQSLQRMRAKEDRAPASVLRPHDTAERFVGEGTVGGWHGKLTGSQAELIEASFGRQLARLGYAIGDREGSAAQVPRSS